nr:hypothetical protein CFP56_03933 [Quercus suber]
MTPSISPSPRTWTLRFKHHRSTIILHVDPLQKFPLVRLELLKAIQQTSQNGQLNNVDIPNDSNEILLAKLVDNNNLRAGWEQMEREEEDLFNGEDVRGKGKAKASAKSTSRSTMKDCPQGAGLRDGSIVAFKFKSESQAEGQDTLDGESLVGEPEVWDVVAPSMEETYGDQDEATDVKLRWRVYISYLELGCGIAGHAAVRSTRTQLDWTYAAELKDAACFDQNHISFVHHARTAR